MKSFLRKSTLKIAAATSVVLFSLMAAFAGSIAWFNATQAFTNRGDDFGVARTKSFFNALHIHAPVSATSESYVFSSTPIGTISFDENDEMVKDYDESIQFGQFDLRDPYHPLLFHFELSDSVTVNEGNSFSVSAETTHSFVGYDSEDLSPTDNPLSWIISAYAIGSNANTIPYTYSVAGLGTGTHFANITNTNGNLSYSGFNKNLTIYQPTNGTTIKHVVIIMDYYSDAIAYIYNRYLGYDVLDQENVPFYMDWVFRL